MPTYQKPALTSSRMVSLLEGRGLLVPDHDRAERYLNNIGYYRLSACFLPFQGQKDVFNKGISFDDILSLYIFDRKLRLLAMDAIQRVGVSVRAAISNHMSIRHDPFWMLNPNLFKDQQEYAAFVDLAKSKAGRRSRGMSPACKHYFAAYGDRDLSPSWIAVEELSMGAWSKIFKNLKSRKDKDAIARPFGINSFHFENWLQSLTILRNALAHHKRFWNASFPFRPPKLEAYAKDSGPLSGSYENFVIIMRMFKCTMRKSTWADRLHELLCAECPFDYHVCMKFPRGWRSHPFWQ